jgi:effector-binding domain-containing protein
LDPEGESEVEAGIPVGAVPVPEGGIRVGVLPAGRYVTTTHTGHPDALFDTAGAVLAWAEERGLRWDLTESGGVVRWGCRLESYLTDPRVEPDPAKWRIELAFRLADEPS